MNILHFSEHVQLIFDNTNVNKQKMAGQVVGIVFIEFICLLQNYKICLSRPSKRNHFGIKSCSYQPQKPAFLLNTSKTWIQRGVVFHFFTQFFFGI